jgi:hypothetical protein
MMKAKKKKPKRRGPRWSAFQRASYPPGVEDIAGDCEVWLNELYQVDVRWFDCTPLGVDGMRHLSIKRIDRKPLHDWRELQLIKNAICGPEFEAVELYPAESRLVDSANQYHLFVLPKGASWPFGYERREVSEVSSQGSVQRPFAPHVKPADLLTPEDVALLECRDLTDDNVGAGCDWGGCDNEATRERLDTRIGYLPVCEACARKTERGR